MGRTALLMVMGFSGIMLMMGLNLSRISIRSYENYVEYYNRTVAHQIAVAVANRYCNELYRFPNARPTVNNISFSGGRAAVTTADSSGGRVWMRVTSEYDGVRDTIMIQWGLSRFSKFAYFSNIEGSIYWISGDTVWGPFHTQQRVNVSGSPVFYGKVTTKNGIFRSPRLSKPKFYGGYQSPVNITLPSDLNPLINAASMGGKLFRNTDVEITFHEDSTITVKEGANPPQRHPIATYARNGTIFVQDGNLRVKGTVAGKLTIGASGSSGAAKGNVWIDDDIVYKRDPQQGPSPDLLGICAQNNIIITDNAANRSDVRIHAALFSLSGGLTAQNFRTRGPSGTIHLIGGITQHQRGPVGIFSGSPPRITNGFYKNYRYDERLMVDSPPFFPLTGSHEILSWYER